MKSLLPLWVSTTLLHLKPDPTTFLSKLHIQQLHPTIFILVFPLSFFHQFLHIAVSWKILPMPSILVPYTMYNNVHNSKAQLLLQMPPSFIRPNIIHNTILWNTSRFGSSGWERVQHSAPYIITGKFFRLSAILSASVGQNNSCMAMIRVFISACHKIGHFFILHPCYS